MAEASFLRLGKLTGVSCVVRDNAGRIELIDDWADGNETPAFFTGERTRILMASLSDYSCSFVVS